MSRDNNNYRDNNNNNTIGLPTNHQQQQEPFYINHYLINEIKEKNENVIKFFKNAANTRENGFYFKLFLKDLKNGINKENKKFLLYNRISIKLVDVSGHIVSIIKKKKFNQRMVTFIIDDSTQTMECDYYPEELPSVITKTTIEQAQKQQAHHAQLSYQQLLEEEQDFQLPFTFGSYIRVWAMAKYDSYENRYYLKVLNLQVVSDPNTEMLIWLETIKLQNEFYIPFVKKFNIGIQRNIITTQPQSPPPPPQQQIINKQSIPRPTSCTAPPFKKDIIPTTPSSSTNVNKKSPTIVTSPPLTPKLINRPTSVIPRPTSVIISSSSSSPIISRPTSVNLNTTTTTTTTTTTNTTSLKKSRDSDNSSNNNNNNNNNSNYNDSRKKNKLIN